MLPLTFSNPGDYEKIREDDRVSIAGLSRFSEGSPLRMIIKHADGTVDEAVLTHSFNDRQIAWFKAGSALNLIAAAGKRKSAKPKRVKAARKQRARTKRVLKKKASTARTGTKSRIRKRRT
jgi:hypothetical protein